MIGTARLEVKVSGLLATDFTDFHGFFILFNYAAALQPQIEVRLPIIAAGDISHIVSQP